MRFLRCTTMEEVNDIIERSSDKMLIYVNNAPAGLPSIGIVQGGAMPATNEVWYTTENNIAAINTQEKDYVREEEFFPTAEIDYENSLHLISNTYSNGRGVLTFDGDVVGIGQNIFNDDYYDDEVENPVIFTSVTLPESVEYIASNAFCNLQHIPSSNIISYGTMSGHPWNQCPS